MYIVINNVQYTVLRIKYIFYCTLNLFLQTKTKFEDIYSAAFSTLNSIVFNTAYRQEEKSSSINKLVPWGTDVFEQYTLQYST